MAGPVPGPRVRASAGDRGRRHRSGRALGRTGAVLDRLCDSAAFRALHRHRLLTIEWQALPPAHGFELPPEVEDAGAGRDWHRTTEESSALQASLHDSVGAA